VAGVWGQPAGQRRTGGRSGAHGGRCAIAHSCRSCDLNALTPRNSLYAASSASFD
jgi:hypothetical protein